METGHSLGRWLSVLAPPLRWPQPHFKTFVAAVSQDMGFFNSKADKSRSECGKQGGRPAGFRRLACARVHVRVRACVSQCACACACSAGAACGSTKKRARNKVTMAPNGRGPPMHMRRACPSDACIGGGKDGDTGRRADRSGGDGAGSGAGARAGGVCSGALPRRGAGVGQARGRLGATREAAICALPRSPHDARPARTSRCTFL